jgi:2'-5' RNA ligase
MSQANRQRNDSPKTIRRFYAFTLTPAARASVSGAMEKLKSVIDSAQIRWTNPADLHITALFLGDFPPDKLSLFIKAGEAASANCSSFPMSIGRFGCFPESPCLTPDATPVRVVWIGGMEPPERPASQIAVKLRENLMGIQLDLKPFKAHITLGYVKERANHADIRKAIIHLPQPDCGQMPVESLSLMQTVPQSLRNNNSDGVSNSKIAMRRYNVVQTFPLAR